MAYVTVKGAGADKTVVEWDDTADRIGPNGRPLGTFASATFAVNSPFFIAKNITFKGLRSGNKAPMPTSGALGKQAAALCISADAAAFVGCRFVGSQDTVYDHVGWHYFRDCYVAGSVDFVFGNGLSFYRGCHLHAVSCSYGAVTAQKRESLPEETGFTFVGCKMTGSGTLFLGRAWGTFSRVVFAYTYMDRIIIPNGWYDWGDKNRDIGVDLCDARRCLTGNTSAWDQGHPSAGECRGLGARELTPEEAKPFVSLNFINARDWLSFALTKP